MMSVKAKLSSHDRHDLEKFMKFLAIKAVQVIVQSRLGERSKTKSKPYSRGAEWFNVAIKDLPEVQTEAKKVLANGLPMFGANMCTEISLKTVDGDTLVLETWSIGMTEKTDPMAKVIPTVYNRMSLLLKSLIAVSRVTPAYKLSSCQGSDSYVICYKVYMGDIQNSQLGEGYQEARIGQVGTPVGTITLNIAYRTKLAITPRQPARQSPIMLKSDYFKPDHSPKHKHRAQGMNGRVVELNQLEQPPTFKDHINQPQKNDNPKTVPKEHCNVEQPESVKYDKNKANSIILNGTEVPKSSGGRMNEHDKRTQKDEMLTNGSIMKFIKFEEMKVGAFAPSKVPESAFLNFLLPDAPFQSLLNHDKDANLGFTNQRCQENQTFTLDKKHGENNVNEDTVLAGKSSKNSRTDKSLDMNQNTLDLAHQKSVWMEDSVCDDFVLVDLVSNIYMGNSTMFNPFTAVCDLSRIPDIVPFTDLELSEFGNDDWENSDTDTDNAVSNDNTHDVAHSYSDDDDGSQGGMAVADHEWVIDDDYDNYIPIWCPAYAKRPGPVIPPLPDSNHHDILDLRKVNYAVDYDYKVELLQRMQLPFELANEHLTKTAESREKQSPVNFEIQEIYGKGKQLVHVNRLKKVKGYKPYQYECVTDETKKQEQDKSVLEETDNLGEFDLSYDVEEEILEPEPEALELEDGESVVLGDEVITTENTPVSSSNSEGSTAVTEANTPSTPMITQADTVTHDPI
ncbi:uncharacterized protein LOC106457497 [Limulus polyphemus]|uniref:Autophagy-related protein 13 n=1 Tax=Limulus polyphemus TaxID=6850 RepID=A0ABM1B0N6_LIMPO|nr:uncharacterized protein LOC106457497 [Limulus polyphemus]